MLIIWVKKESNWKWALFTVLYTTGVLIILTIVVGYLIYSGIKTSDPRLGESVPDAVDVVLKKKYRWSTDIKNPAEKSINDTHLLHEKRCIPVLRNATFQLIVECKLVV